MGSQFTLDFDATSAPAVAIRRKVSKRQLRTDLSGTAAACIGHIEPGDEISGLTNGQFSLVDMLLHLAQDIGPCDLTISTWTMGVYDADQAFAFTRQGLFRSTRWIVDPSFFSRNAALSGRLVDSFGADAFRAVNTHAKFATMRSDRVALVVRTSCNLNRNDRMESFDISADEQLTAFYEAQIADIFERHAPVGKRPGRAKALFSDLAEGYRSTSATPFPITSNRPF